MSDRLTTQLDDGNLERLRILAGGTRKVGAFLSEVTALLWKNKEKLEAAPLSDYTLVPQTDADVLKAAALTQSIEQEIKDIEYRMDEVIKLLEDIHTKKGAERTLVVLPERVLRKTRTVREMLGEG